MVALNNSLTDVRVSRTKYRWKSYLFIINGIMLLRISLHYLFLFILQTESEFCDRSYMVQFLK